MEQQYDIENEIEINLRELLAQIFGYWKLILLVVVLSAGVAFSISKFVLVPQYESTAVLYVLSKSASITSLADIETGSSLTNDYMVVVKSRPVLDQVINNLNIDSEYSEFSEKVKLNNPSNSRLLEITVTDENPVMAKQIADEIAKVSSAFIAAKMDQDAPQTTQYGYADGTPVSPNVLINTLLGGLIGGVMTMAIIIIAYLYNDTITDPTDIEKKLGMNLLGSLPFEEESEYDGEKNSRKRKRANKRLKK